MKQRLILGIVLIFIAGTGYTFLSRSSQPKSDPDTTSGQNSTQNSSPEITKTIPDPLNESIIPADQIIEITFNLPLQNAPEFKVRIEPKIDFKVELSSDRKTARIITAKPYDLGASYTLYIASDTKFDGAGNWGKDRTFHFRTVKYRGI